MSMARGNETHNNVAHPFPFLINSFYEKKQIWRPLGIAGQGGIRPNKRLNFVVVFFDTPELKPIPGRSHNIYADFYDTTTGLYRYTGEGQKGDQKLAKGNLWLVNAKKNGTRIHFFEQHSPGGLHEYLGEVDVESHGTEIQKDVYGNKRTVFVFWLRPVSNHIISEEDVIQREIDSELNEQRKLARTKDELEREAQKLSALIAKRGPKRALLVARSAKGYERFKGIVTLLKMIYDTECQVCGTRNFETDSGVYSEVHHLISWSTSHDDTRENLVVLCANCHKRFHHAKVAERIRMYKQLVERFADVRYQKPPYFEATNI